MPRRSISAAFWISIPAPVKGRTGRRGARRFYFDYFNSRPREGANHGRVRGCDCPCISIPAPVKGRTCAALLSTTGRTYFNSRPREGANSKTVQNRAVYLVSLLKFGRISAISPYILSATRAKKRETPKIIGFLPRRPTGKSCMEQVGAAGSVRYAGTRFLPSAARSRRWG